MDATKRTQGNTDALEYSVQELRNLCNVIIDDQRKENLRMYKLEEEIKNLRRTVDEVIHMHQNVAGILNKLEAALK